MSFEIHHAVIHGFTKESNTNEVTDVVKKNTVLDCELPAVVSLVKGVNSLLGKPGNILSYGQFGDDMRQGKFPSGFDAYIGNATTEKKFLKLSHMALDELVNEARQENFATGGNLLIAYYSSDGRPFFLVAMIKQRGGIQLDANFVPVEIVEVDLSKVHQAARINLNRYAEVKSLPAASDEDGDSEDRTYLSFVGAQRAAGQAAGYFIKALGCTKGIASSRATQNAIEAVKEFFNRPELKKHRVTARNAVAAYLQEKLQSGHNAVLTEIAHAATACLAGTQEEVVEDLKGYLNNEKSKVPAVFAVHGGTLKKNTRIKAEGPSWSVQFDRSSLGKTQNSTVFFNEANKSLTFNNIDEKTMKEISDELALRNG